ncbi:30S ribosome-binding factor RbfA [Chondromyces crocatus]|uniref:Ribosome-binding factor A n=1 Tax=Chondromyces crocatus TaxID=52 RepID=A0A0K1ECZ9_CHOCO|nr:30S ribosome-binding factor RbfA [Chondromyces crocatus]AKT38750.1 ribosome-binding factor A [Chondromyces crocatus]
MKDGGKRTGRVGEALRAELAREIRALNDPRVLGVIVSRVEIDPDLARAKIYVRHDLGVAEPSARREILRGLAAASGRLRRDVARRLTLRSMPELHFHYDEALDEQRRIEEILHEIKSEEAQRKPGGSSGAPQS